MSAHPGIPPHRIAVVIPCYRVRAHVLDVIAAIGPEVAAIYVVDDACPDGTGELVRCEARDPRVTVLTHAVNQGVGGATLTGMRRAAEDGATILVKIDGDGQMDPALLPRIVRPILEGEADYAKGNRFHDLDQLREMPAVRLVGNAALSFFSKLSSGYWNVFDPTNGYVAIHGDVLMELPRDKIAHRYFFESDMLFRLNLARAVVADVPMAARYRDETSNLKIGAEIPRFLAAHLRNFAKRLFYSYVLRDVSIASIYLLLALLLLPTGILLGAAGWSWNAAHGVPATAGTVMLAGLPVILGMQFLVAFLAYDTGAVPRRPIHKRLRPFSLPDARPPAAPATADGMADLPLSR
ncbi:glycosyltransferase family 2 protein [Azospirillum agricola]|uniref:glycosyltransferase family 2 protein n=1 Tax=Azospirillum agricola TaxID=1720247 RepID=UPI000A0F3CCF|nr:glycosyltransferase family 2 protein [Azospirillum agricola]SMH41037.1 Glycosyltransferase, GT2 family [Azospirillum lipoferum]